MRRIVKGLGIAFLFIFSAPHVSAEEIMIETTSVLNQNNLSYVPTRMVTNQLQAPVAWNNELKSLVIHKDDTYISFKLGDSKATVNQEVVDSPPIVVKDGVSYLPLRFIAQSLGMKTEWTQDLITLTTYDKYIVQASDSLYKISQNVGLSVEDIKTMNNLEDDKLQIGQVIYVTANQTKKGVGTVEPPPSPNFNKMSEASPIVYDDMIHQQSTTVSGMSEIEQEKNKQSQDEESQLEREEEVELNQEEEEVKLDQEKKKRDEEQDEGRRQQDERKIIEKENGSTISYTPYIVRRGDTLTTISTTYKVSLSDLIAYNGLSESSVIYIGDQLLLPKREIPKQVTTGEFGEYLDWWTAAQYVFPIGDIATVTDVETGMSFGIRRSYGANHADCEPLTADDTAIAKEIWGGFTWNTRAVIVQTEDRTIAASMSLMPHDIQTIEDNEFEGHFDLHFKNSTRHKDGKIDTYHQEKIKVAAGVL